MSTKIYNGIKFKTNDIYELYDLLNDFKIESSLLLRKGFDKKLPFILKQVMKDYYIEHKNLDSVWEIADLFKKDFQKNDFRVDYNNYIQIYPHPETKALYGYFILDSESENLLLSKDWVEDYHYQNSSDGPDDMSYEEYSKRGDLWDELFASSYKIEDSGFKYKIMDFSEIFFYQDSVFNKYFKINEESITRELKLERIIGEDE